ncbi:(Fe-S)-binding protein [Thiobacter aerophilum]|uniref:Glycolate oxidase iron-sulfur subunit n=1 Tax=Thiobacter aerophilum TaxID=3121275 RepID=A0ABV0EFA5_9BURK
MTVKPESQALAAQASRCVACGLCVPHCPTYRKLESEADSPRGRVMLIRALAEGRLAAEPTLVTHLDRCLVCRACEAVCPAGVKYGELIDGARAWLAAEGKKPRGLAGWLPAVLSAPPLLAAAAMRLRGFYPARGERQGTVSLFLGCVTRLADGSTLRAAIFVLTHLGFDVRVPRGQGCCGAMHQHAGEQEQAAQLARKNIEVFAKTSLDATEPILFCATGCGATLVEYARYGTEGEAFAHRAQDVVSFLARAPGWERLPIAPLAQTVAVHEPCSGRNVLRNAADVYGLLGRIPGLQAVPLAGNEQCCGAAGLYFLRQPALARRLRADKMPRAGDALRMLVSTNQGCAHWLKQGLSEAGHRLEVEHPVQLVARQLGFTGRC